MVANFLLIFLIPSEILSCIFGRGFLQQHINPLDYTAVILNSKLGADHYFRLCEEMRLNVPDSMHYYCISETVGNYLQKFIQFRKRKVFYSEKNKFEDLLPAMYRRLP